MKKSIFIIVSFFLFFINVKAEDNYYLNKENKIGQYLSKISNLQNNYQYKDYNDILYLPYSNWQDNCDVNMDEYEIQYKDIYVYQNISDINYIIIDNLNSDNINKLEIYDKENLINYKIEECIECNNLINNIDESNKYILALEENINPKNLMINIDIKNNNLSTYNISLVNDKQEVILDKEYATDITNINIDETWNNYDIFNDLYYLDEKIEDSIFNKYIESKKLCRYRKYLIYNYNFENEIVNNNKDNEDEQITFDIKYNDELITKPINNVIEQNYEENTNEENNEIKENINNTNDIKNKNNNDLQPNNKFIKTLKVSNDTSIVKYLILVVIALTIIYIIISNKRLIKRKK